MSIAAPKAVIVIRNEYQWMLDPRYGRIAAYIDGRKAGRIEIRGELTVEVEPDVPHDVRARLWWYRSPVVRLSLAAGESRVLRANIRKDLPLFKGMALMALHPSTCLHLGDGPP